MKRLFDVYLALFVGMGLMPILIILFIVIRLSSKGPALYWSQRVGKDNQFFFMPKFRSMRIDTPTVASHLLSNPTTFLTPVGGFLRKTSLDELPQLWSILKGDMSFVGPRPALYNQDDLIRMRTKLGIDGLLPGLTGWAQIHGRDELNTDTKVSLDYYYLLHQSFKLDMHILLLTIIKVIRSEGVLH
jgi:O-antigen biosynthesis protein WbqP